MHPDDLKIVLLLLDAGADASWRDADGKDAYDMAVDWKCKDTLLVHKAYREFQDRRKESDNVHTNVQ